MKSVSPLKRNHTPTKLTLNKSKVVQKENNPNIVNKNNQVKNF